MSDKTDPRLEVAKGWVAEDWERELRKDDIPFPDDSLTERAVDMLTEDMLTDFDAADRAAGIVRVDTRDEALVERLEPVVYYERYGHNASHGGVMEEVRRDACRSIVRAVLAAMRETP